ncbi:MAG: sigma-70 family RNA polymerase sigma factor [Anaerolineales bacterium]|nr:MAG: sigma-70 family RNA polymerase sigma factor [Anaerolineales bacterium]
MMNPEETLKRIKRFDLATLAEIHDQYYPQIYRYVCYRLGENQVCEDISSEVFLRLLDALHRKRGPRQNLRGWLFGTASNLVNDHLRGLYRRQVESLDQGYEQSNGELLEKNYEQDWVQEQVRRAIQQLTSEQQHVLALRYSEERSLEETAEIMGKSLTAVKGLQFRAIGALRRILGDQFQA